MKPLFLLAIIFTATTSHSQGKIQRETISTDSMSVTYGRPYKNGTTIFGNLQKFGNVCAIGGDGGATITFNRAVTFGGANVPAGTYAMFVIPHQNEWTIILNPKLGLWGAMSYEKFKDQDIARITVPVTSLH
jgi:hypothetical protein